MGVSLKEKKLEIALVGTFQCGKSTLFDAILEGRDLSPLGVGIKTSACAITARAIAKNRKEYAEIKWRSPEVLKELTDVCNAENGNDVDESDIQEKHRLAVLISRFNDTWELSEWRNKTRITIPKVHQLLAYPKDWEYRWQQDKDGELFALNDVLFLFVERIIYHIHSDVLNSLGCDLTDSPGFGIGAWDETLAREAMLCSDVIICVLDGSKSTISPLYLRYLSWLSQVRLSDRLIYVLNVHGSRKIATTEWLKTNIATLRQKGLSVSKKQMPIVNAVLGLYAMISRHCGDDSDARKVAVKALARYLDFDPLDEHDMKEMRSCLSQTAKISRVSGFDTLMGSLQAFLSTYRENAQRGELDSPLVKISADGGFELEAGYAWNDDSTIVSRLTKGVSWKSGIEHVNAPNVLSTEDVGRWRPAPGYSFLNDDDGDFRVKWTPGKQHPEYIHVIAGDDANDWIPEPGYIFVNKRSGDFRVNWKPGDEDSAHPHIIAADTEGSWMPEPGYVWIDSSSDESKLRKGVRWQPCVYHPKLPHVYSGAGEGQWLTDPGYEWRDARSRVTKLSNGVYWRSGVYHPTIAHIYTSDTEGRWLKDPGYRWRVMGDAFAGVVWIPGQSHPNDSNLVAADREGEWESAFVHTTKECSKGVVKFGRSIWKFITEI